MTVCGDEPHITFTYFFVGHLPGKEKFYSKRLRPLAATYLTFSADGHDILVNLGGEQVTLPLCQQYLLRLLQQDIFAAGVLVFRAEPVASHHCRLQGHHSCQRLVRYKLHQN